MPIIIRQPQNSQEWDQYFELRWHILRQPWQQPPGSEKDELEKHSIHRLAMRDNKIIAVGRLHFTDDSQAQIRYMAVAKGYQRKGLGKLILNSLEQVAREKDIKSISLNARETAVPFYQSYNYQLAEQTHTLYNSIKHYRMYKLLT